MRREVDGAALHLVVTGEVEFGSCDVVVDAIEQALRERPVGLLVDVGGVSFMDSSGVGTLIRGLKRARALGVAFRVVEVRGRVARVLDVIGVLPALTGGGAGRQDGR